MSGWSGPRTRSRSARVCSCRGSPRRSGPRPGRRRRGCCGRSGCRGGRGPGPVRGRRGSARAGDRLGGAARGPVGDGEVVAGGQGVGVVRAQDPLAGRRAVARRSRWPGRRCRRARSGATVPIPEPQQVAGPGRCRRGRTRADSCRAMICSTGPGRQAGSVPAWRSDSRQAVEQPRSALRHTAARAPAAARLLPDHPHHQPVRGHGGAVHAEGQQRRPPPAGPAPVSHLAASAPAPPVAARQAAAGRRHTAAPGGPRPATAPPAGPSPPCTAPAGSPARTCSRDSRTAAATPRGYGPPPPPRAGRPPAVAAAGPGRCR